MTSVTQLLETFPEKELVDWMLRNPEQAQRISQEALQIGTAVDKCIQADCLGSSFSARLHFPTLPTAPAIQLCLEGWEQFLADHSGFLLSITGVQQELHRGEYVGHPDLLLRHFGTSDHSGDQIGICEIKCAAQIRPVHWTQVAAYSWLQNMEENADFLAILRLDKVRGSYEYVELTDPGQIDEEVKVWLAYKALYEHRIRVAERGRFLKEQEALDA